MKAHVLKGSKREIAETLIQMRGEVSEAIVFEDDSSPAKADLPQAHDIFAEMRPFMSDVQEVDDSRAGVYTRMVQE